MAELNPAQQSHVRATLARVAELLSDAVRALDREDGEAAFSRYVQDAAPVQHKLASDYAAKARVRMNKALDMLGVPASQPVTGAIHAARTIIVLAQIALEGIEPGAIRGYGRRAFVVAAVRQSRDATQADLELLKRLAAGQGASTIVSARPAATATTTASRT